MSLNMLAWNAFLEYHRMEPIMCIPLWLKGFLGYLSANLRLLWKRLSFSLMRLKMRLFKIKLKSSHQDALLLTGISLMSANWENIHSLKYCEKKLRKSSSLSKIKLSSFTDYPSQLKKWKRWLNHETSKYRILLRKTEIIWKTYKTFLLCKQSLLCLMIRIEIHHPHKGIE